MKRRHELEALIAWLATLSPEAQAEIVARLRFAVPCRGATRAGSSGQESTMTAPKDPARIESPSEGQNGPSDAGDAPRGCTGPDLKHYANGDIRKEGLVKFKCVDGKWEKQPVELDPNDPWDAGAS